MHSRNICTVSEMSTFLSEEKYVIVFCSGGKKKKSSYFPGSNILIISTFTTFFYILSFVNITNDIDVLKNKPH